MISEHYASITGYAPQSTQAVISVDQIPPGRRVGRAVAGFGLFLLLAVVSVFIPAAHFLLVPGFLITAFVVLAVRLGQRAVVVGAKGTCPDCGAEQDLDLPRSWRLPVDTACRSCQRRLTLTAV